MRFVTPSHLADSEAAARKLLWRHDSGVFVKFTPAGAELFA
jgi:hypothetical protein